MDTTARRKRINMADQIQYIKKVGLISALIMAGLSWQMDKRCHFWWKHVKNIKRYQQIIICWGQEMKIRQDTWCSGTAVRTSLVSDDQMTSKKHLCLLINRITSKFPIAKIKVSVLRWRPWSHVNEEPINNLVIRNVTGSEDMKELDITLMEHLLLQPEPKKRGTNKIFSPCNYQKAISQM